MTLEPFQRRLLTDYFDGVRETLVLIPKKNAKTTTLAAVALYHLLTTPDATCYIGASSRDQARILFDQAEGLVNRSGWLRDEVQVQGGYLRINSRHDGGRIKVLAADAGTADGVIPTLALVDELHRHKSPDLYAVFRDGLGAKQGQMITISTAGDDEETTLGKIRSEAHSLPGMIQQDAYRYARTESFAFHEWGLESSDDKEDLKTVKLANPASWQTVKELKIRHDSPTMKPWEWARFACGIWMVGEDSAISEAEWRECASPGVEIDEDGDVVLGIDFGWRWDTTAMVPVAKDGEMVVVGEPTILTPPQNGSSMDENRVFGAIVNYIEQYPNLRIVLDPNAGGEFMAQRISREYGTTVIEHAQAASPMALAAQRLSDAIGRKEIAHPDDRELTRHVLAAMPKSVGEGWRFWKSKKRNLPIDGVIALAMGHSILVAADENGPSVYEERELLVL